MISEQAFETLRAFVDVALEGEWGPVRHRLELRQALDALERAQQRAQEATVAADPDPEFVQRMVDTTLVEHTIRRHAEIMLKHMSAEHIPQPGDVYPTYSQAMAAWHMARIVALRNAPVDMAAQRIREDALAALTPTTKEGEHG